MILTLDKEQVLIIDSVVSDILRGRKEVSIGGLAGTGKSTISKEIISTLQNRGLKVVVLCPTGKAANVLRTKGVNADTIHSAIYNYKGKFEDDDGNELINWENKDKINDDPDVLVIDEASMVSTKLATDLRELNKKIVWIGDYGQLPPVGGDPKIMAIPDYVLEKNYRQGNSEIVDFALTVRRGGYLHTSKEVTQLKRYPWRKLIEQYQPDQAILGFNRSRVKFNQLYRKILGYKPNTPQIGDRIICVHNNRQLWVFNGMQFIIKDILAEDARTYKAVITSIDNNSDKTVSLLKSGFNQERYETEGLDKTHMVADFGYGITCHKSQGSEWDKVLVFNQECRAWDQRRWLYTAATRAKNELIVNY